MYVYVLQNAEGVLYKGITQNLEKRIDAHNNGSGRWTTGKGPWHLVYSEQVVNRSEAMKREKFLKSGQGRRFLQEILG